MPGILERLEVRCWGGPGSGEGRLRREQVVGGPGAGALRLDITWLKDWSLQKLQCLGPTHLEERSRREESGATSDSDVLPACPLGWPLRQPLGSWALAHLGRGCGPPPWGSRATPQGSWGSPLPLPPTLSPQPDPALHGDCLASGTNVICVSSGHTRACPRLCEDFRKI